MRRYAPLKASRGTVIPSSVRADVLARDGICVGTRLLIPHDCQPYNLELDHVRASGGLGMKSESTASNLVATCPVFHRMKTENGRLYRPVLIDYIEALERPEAVA